MKITVAKLTKQRLAAIPANERALFLLLSHVLNEINVFEKLILAGTKGSPHHRIVDIVEAGQGLILLRTLVGKLHEAKLLIEKRVNGDADLKSRHALCGQSLAAKQLRSLNKHFARNGRLLAAVRNTFAFHSTDDDGLVEESFKALPEEEPWEFYLGQARSNAFYYAAELCVTRAVLGHTTPYKLGRPDDGEGLKELISATLKASRFFTDFAITLMVEIINTNFPEGIEDASEDIGHAPKMSGFQLPFFFDDDDLASIREARETAKAMSKP